MPIPPFTGMKVLPISELPQALQGLSTDVKIQLAMTLANDENSTDEEIIEFWTKECDIPEAVANAAIPFRTNYFTQPFFELF